MEHLTAYLREVNTASIIVRLALICLLAGVIGIERGTKRRPAGFRTHMLVGMGATMVMITGQYMIEIRGFATDATRLGAQVVSGIGFLGAGTIIMVGRNQVKGLTTAAGLWACACMGLAIGIGFYEGAIIGGLFLFFVMMGLHRLDEYVHLHSKVLELYMELDDMAALTRLLEFVKNEGTKVSNLEIHRIKNENYQGVGVLITLSTRRPCDHTNYIVHLHEVEGIRAIEEIL